MPQSGHDGNRGAWLRRATVGAVLAAIVLVIGIVAAVDRRGTDDTPGGTAAADAPTDTRPTSTSGSSSTNQPPSSTTGTTTGSASPAGRTTRSTARTASTSATSLATSTTSADLGSSDAPQSQSPSPAPPTTDAPPAADLLSGVLDLLQDQCTDDPVTDPALGCEQAGP